MANSEAVKNRLGYLAAGLTPVFIFWLLDFIEPRYFFRNDTGPQLIPLYYDSARAWLHGEIPLLSPYCWNASNTSGQYLSATFSIFSQLLFIVTSFIRSEPDRARWIASVLASFCSLGYYRLARSWGWPRMLSWSAAITASLNGWAVFNCYRDGLSACLGYAWIPWVWWCLDTPEESRKQRVLLWVSLYAVFTGGFYFTDLMGALLVLCYFFRNLFQRDWPRLADCLIGGCAAAATALPAILLLLIHSLTGSRPTGVIYEKLFHPIFLSTLFLPLRNLSIFGKALSMRFNEWTYWRGYFVVGYDYGVGFVPALAIVLGLILNPLRYLRARPMLFVLCVASLCLSCAPLAGGARWSVRWSQFSFAAVALLGHQALFLLDQNQGFWKARIGPMLAPLIPMGVVALLLAEHANRRVVAWAVLPALWVAFAWMVIWRVTPRWRVAASSLISVAIVMATLSLQVVPDSERTQPPYPIDTPMKALDPSRLYLSLHTIFEYVQWDRPPEWNMLRPGNRAMAEEVRLMNGYDPLQPQPLVDSLKIDFVGSLSQIAGMSCLKEARPGGLLSRWGVDGLLVSPTFKPAADGVLPNMGWKKTFEAARTAIWERPKLPEYFSPTNVSIPAERPSSLLRMLVHNDKEDVSIFLPDRLDEVSQQGKFGNVTVTDYVERRNGLSARVATDQQPRSLLVLRRIYAAGYVARLNGQAVPVGIYDGVNLAVLLPGHSSGQLQIDFRPPGLAMAFGVSGLGFFLALFWALKGSEEFGPEPPEDEPDQESP